MRIKFNTFNLKRTPHKKHFTWFEFSITQWPDSYHGWWIELIVFNQMFNINISGKTVTEYLESHSFNG